jgi:GPH family glycoside/pentoside/hexuronide:cation symporter
MLYYITVLLELKDDMLMTFMIVLIVSSFSIYPLVNKVAKIYSRKKLIELAFIVFSIVFLLVFFLGRIPLPAKLQATILVILASIPFAFLGILPNTILADIAEFDTLENGSRREGMFFAARTMIMKLGQTFGIIIFTVLLQFGKDPGNDLGVRLSGVCGFILCLIATFIFHQYDESKILKKIKK